MTSQALHKENKKRLLDLYIRAQNLYFSKYGSYYQVFSEMHTLNKKLSKDDLCFALNYLSGKNYGFGWHNGYIPNKNKCVAQMILPFESLAELDLKLTIAGH